MRCLALALLCLPSLAVAQPQPNGRYQVTAAIGTPPTIVMHDTSTGQSWVLVQTPGPPVQWAPVRFWGPQNSLTPLPPTPTTVGTRAAAEATPPR
ncbi:hypothetical protein [Plastoroseomonas arctica]|uniref:SH3 domain-containing protein n=1 Tax=Plastoroseomonas arctica TaxID=1509237 RepID=A0AAF1JXV6_9PROT|nr:hypothetical protein [Plastoroseomonas arctica]MBR0655675.1 hypothetical protein [Plastoroseomonas arctica]